MTTMPCNKCGKEIMIPYLLRNFEIRQTIASGGMGTVYRAFDTILKREVAVKLMKKELGRDAKVLDEFYREARMVAKLNHPNIIQIYNFGEMDGENFIAMELADKGSLESRAEKNGGRLPELEVLDAGIKIAGALEVCFNQGLLHRDIKPANILFNGDNEPKLVDFGLAREADKEDAYGEEVWGTPEYSAPEKFKRESETFKSDMYSLGCALYQSITGRLPFAESDVNQMVRGHLEVPVQPPNELVPEISSATSEALVKTLAKKPKDRFATYGDLVMALTAARSQLLVASGGSPKTRTTKGLTGMAPKSGSGALPRAVTQAAPVGPAGGGGKKTGLMVAAVVLLAALAGGGFFFFGKKSETPAPDPKGVESAPKVEVTPLPKPGEWLNLSGTELASGLIGMNGKPLHAGWQFENDQLTFNADGRGNLATHHSFSEFDLSFDWKAEPGAHAAVHFGLDRNPDSLPDTFKFLLRDRAPASPAAAGALAGVLPPAKDVYVRDPKDFNTGRLVVLTNHVEFWINGRKAVAFNFNGESLLKAIAASELQSRPGYGRRTSGFVGIDSQRGVVFKNLKIRVPEKWPADLPLPSIRPITLKRPDTTGPFVNLSETNAIKLWRTWNSTNPPSATYWKFESGFITALGGERPPMLVTRERHLDYELTFEWKVEKGVKSSILLGLQALPETAAQNAYRIALADDTEVTNSRALSGALLNWAPVATRAAKPAGQFNSARIVAFNNQVEVWINGLKTTEFNLNSKGFKDQIPKSEYKDRPLFGKTTEGWIGIQPNAGLVIRAMKIRDLAEYSRPQVAPQSAPKKKKQ